MRNLAWEIRVTQKAAKQIKKLGNSEARRISVYLKNRISQLDDPRQLGKALKGSTLGSFWRYRVGDYRILCEMQDNKLIILVIEVGHRRDVYK